MSPRPLAPSIALTISVLGAALFPLSANAQTPKVLAPHKPIAPKLAQPLPLPPAVAGSMVGGPWMVDGDFKSSIYLRNGVETSPITVTPVLYLSNGVRYALPNVQLEPAGTAVVDINAALQSLGIAPYATLSGYVELDYNWPWDPICATIHNLDVSHSLVYSYGLRSTKPIQIPNQPPPSATPIKNIIEGLWWKQEKNVTGFVALANTTAQPLTATVQVSDNRGIALGQQTVQISPHGMKLVSLDELASVATAEGGIRIAYTGMPTDLLVNGGLEDKNSGYSAKLRFSPEPASTQSSEITVAELGLMNGLPDPMMRFPSGITFTPYSVLRNVSASPLTATPTLWWMSGNAAQHSQLPPITLSPLQAQTLDLPALLATAGLKQFAGSVNLVFDVQGSMGGLLMAAGSVDQTNTYVFEVTPHGIVEGSSKSLSYWSTANGDDTMVSLWNPADEPQDFIFELTFAGGHYGYPLHLGPRETRTFNISEISESQIPDAEGNIIPGGVHAGGATIMGSTHQHNEHVLLAMDAGTYNVRKATCTQECQTCNGVSSYSVAANPFTVAVGGHNQLTFYANWNTGAQYNYNSSGSWTTNNSAVATVGTKGNGTPGLVAGVSVGSPLIEVTSPATDPAYTSYWCEEGTWSCPRYNIGGNGSSSGNSTPTVTIGTFSQNPILKGSTATVTITVNPSATISLAITSSGSGAAKFDSQGGGTSKTISGTATVTIFGATASTATGDLTLSASYNGSPLATSSFSVTSGACTLSNESDSGSGPKNCPSTVTLQSRYTVSQYCSTCTYSCVGVHTDGTWAATGCSTNVGTHIVGSLTGSVTTTATGTFQATDCNYHTAYFVTAVTNAQNVVTNSTSATLDLKCNSYPNGSSCP